MSHTLFSSERLVILSEIPSTNDWLKKQNRENLRQGIVVQALHQTEGRGQMGGNWISAPGENLTFSIFLTPPSLSVKHAFYLSKVTSIALAEAIGNKLPSLEVKIKWPNDIWVEGKKIAGILIENQLEGTLLSSAIIGIGLNVNQRNFGPELRDKASSISIFSGQDEDLSSFLWDILDHFEKVYAKLVLAEWEELDQKYYKHLLGFQQLGKFEKDGQEFHAWIEGVELNGRLILRIGGQRRTWDIKEIVWKGII